MVQIHDGPPLVLRSARGDVAQLGEHRLCKPEVTGSSPVVSTTQNQEAGRRLPFRRGLASNFSDETHLENCIVYEATICKLYFGSSKEGRTVDALALRADEGRGKQRYCPGELQASLDPGISEWGNLAPIMRRRLRLNT